MGLGYREGFIEKCIKEFTKSLSAVFSEGCWVMTAFMAFFALSPKSYRN